MVLNTTQQLQQVLEKSKHILLVLPTEKNSDALAAALSLKLFLKKQYKQADIVADGFVMPKILKFLPGIEEIKPELTHLQKFIIKVDVSKAKIETLSYDIKDNWLSIYLTPQQGTISKNELRTAQSTFKYDLIVTLGAQDLESLGSVFYNNTDLFYRVPVVNFDFHPGNEHYGQINLVELTATATCEVVFKTLQQLGEAYLDEQIATCLLTGMISQTKSFKTTNVTPHTLGLASDLMNLGADREKIIQHLYRTRSLGALKLWGDALTNLQSDRDIGLVWSTITRENFARSGASEEDLKDVISELISNSPEAKLILILFEAVGADGKTIIKGLLDAEKGFDARSLLKSFNSSGNKKTASLTLENKSLKEAEELVLKAIKDTARVLN